MPLGLMVVDPSVKATEMESAEYLSPKSREVRLVSEYQVAAQLWLLASNNEAPFLFEQR